MQTFDGKALMAAINHQLTPFRKTQTDAMQGFGQMAKAAMTEGAVSAKHKEMIALAIGVAEHCGGCVAFHVKALKRLGCTRQELEEVLAVCVYMGGGPGLMTAADALSVWDALDDSHSSTSA